MTVDITTVVADLQKALADAQSIVVPPPAPAGKIVTLGLSFPGTGLQPFACAHTFKRGDVPSGSSVVASVPTFQCIPWSFHDDGSVRHAHIAGYASGGIDLSLGTPAAGTIVSAKQPNVQIVTPFGTVDATKLTPTKTIISGPQMSQFVGLWPIGADPILQAYIEWRVWKNGEIEVLPPCIENCPWTAVATTQVGVVTVSINGTQTLSASVTLAHHSRTFLMSGSQWSYGASYTVLHDPAYLTATESIPPYTTTPPTLGVVGKHTQTFQPGYCGDDGPGMSDTGYHVSIGLNPLASVLCITVSASEKQQAWNYMMSQSFSAGSWSSHYRDPATGEAPKFSSYPTYGLENNATVSIPPGVGATNGTWDTAHQGSFVYVSAVLSGWYWFIEEHLFWTTANHFFTSDTLRQGAKGLLRTDIGSNTDRGGAWCLRTLAQAVAICPTTHPNQADLVASWQANMAWYRGRYVDGTIDSGYVNNLGVIGPYSSSGSSLYTGADTGNSSAWWGAGWMQSFLTQSLGHALQMKLPVGAQAQSDNAAVFQFSAKLIIGLIGTQFNWRRAFVYAMPFASDGTQPPSLSKTWYADYGAVWNSYNAGLPLAIDALPGGTMKHGSDDLTVADWQAGFAQNHWPALAYAVVFNVPGASSSLALVTGSASWSVTGTWPDVPTGCVLPSGVMLATPAPPPPPAPGSVGASFYTSMPSGTIKNVSLNTVAKVDPCPANNCAWSGVSKLGGLFNDTGVTFIQEMGALGSLVFCGGGHNDYYGNEVYCFDLATQLVSRLTDPWPTLYRDPNAVANQGTLTVSEYWRLYHAHQQLGELWVDGTFPPFGTGDGTPCPIGNKATLTDQPGSSHMYGYQVALPPGFGHTDPMGALLTTCRPSLTPIGSAVGVQDHILPMTPGADGKRHWMRLSSNLMTQGPGFTGAFLDRKRSIVLSHTYSNNFDVIDLNSKTRRLQKITGLVGMSPYYGTWMHDEARDLYVWFRGPMTGSGPLLWVIDPVTFAQSSPIVSGPIPVPTNEPGGATWVEAIGGFVYYDGDGGTTAYSVIPSGDPKSSAWMVTPMQFSGDTPAAQFSASQSTHMKRFVYVDALNGFLWTASTVAPIQFWRL